MTPSNGFKRTASLPPRRAARRAVRRTIVAVAGAAALLGVLWIGAVTIGVPWLIGRAIETHPQRFPGQQLSVERITVRGGGLGVELAQLMLTDSAAGWSLAAPQVELDFSPRTLLERRPVLDGVVLRQAGVRVERDSPGESTLLARLLPVFEPAAGSLGTHIGRLEWVDGVLELDGTETGDRATGWAFSLTADNWDRRAGTVSAFALDAAAPDGGLLAFAGDWQGGESRSSGRFRASALAMDGMIAMTGADFLVDAAGDYRLSAMSEHAEIEWRMPQATLSAAGRESWSFSDATATWRFARATSHAPQSGAIAFEASGRQDDAGPASLSAVLARDDRGATVIDALSLLLEHLPAGRLSHWAEQTVGAALTDGRAAVRLELETGGVDWTGSVSFEGAGLVWLPDEASSPVELAVALLEDTAGRIELRAPISAPAVPGRAPVELASEALRERVAALTAAPIETLEAVVGMPGVLGAIAFEPGSAELADPAGELLATLAAALRERPRLALELPGAFDPDLDRRALATQQVELHVTLATAGPTLRARPVPVDFTSPRAWDVLEEFAGERLNATQRAQIDQRFAAARAASEPAARAPYYRALFDALVAREPIAPAAIDRLGRFRAQSTADALVALGLARERVSAGPAEPVPPLLRQWTSVPVELRFAPLRAGEN
jgi:hypothetical protein